MTTPLALNNLRQFLASFEDSPAVRSTGIEQADFLVLLAKDELPAGGGKPRTVRCRRCGTFLDAVSDGEVVVLAGDVKLLDTKAVIRCGQCGGERVLFPGRR